MRMLLPLAVVASLALALVSVRPGYSGDAKQQTTSFKTVSAQNAQDKDAKSPKKAGKKKSTRKRKKARGRLPNYYGQIGISRAQRAKIYEIQATHRTQIEELRKRIEELTSQRNQEVYAVLTDQQRGRLAELLDRAKKKRAKRKKKRSTGK